jgi:hypothetical protein
MPRPRIPEVAPLIRDYYALDGNSTGGSLHLVLDDGNVRRRHVEFCRDYALDLGDQAGVEIADMLLLMTVSQRRRLSGMRFYPW